MNISCEVAGASHHSKLVITCLVVGEGMQPEFCPGDELYIDLDRRPDHGNYVIACLSDKCSWFERSDFYVGQFLIHQGKPVLQSLDPGYQPIEVDESKIWGVVVFRGKSFN